RRFLPSLVVSNALVTAEDGGLAGRPPVEVPGVRGLCLAGDWVGPEGMLADASLASAEAAAQALLGRRNQAAREAPLVASFQEHERYLWGLCYRLTGSAAEADDVVQDTFVRALERPPAR